MQRYSVAISPPDAVLEQVRQMKQKVKEATGWYASVNALAHISFGLFDADDQTLSAWEAYIESFARKQSPVSLRFDRTGSFANGAFILVPDERSGEILAQMIKDFHDGITGSPAEPILPHMSIGRRLKPGQLSIARSLIKEVAIDFTCDDLALRRFNPERRQYDIYRRFPFGN